MRKEITALRSLAVIAVLLYHAKIPYFTRAYLGVDVFFVISGYLITGKILTEINEGTFTLRNFYLNRIKRLLPAYFFLTVVVSLFVYLYFFPEDVRNFSQSLTSSILYVSNFFFWADTNYFSKAIEFKPLAHTWSLSIEEQFYLLLPISILFINKFNKKYLKPLILIAIIISFSITVPTSIETYTKFYLLPFRVWEMLVGSILIFINTKKSSSESVSFFGLLLIIFSFIYPTSELNHPGLSTLPVILGTSLIILYGSKTKYLNKIFSLKFITTIGLASYSIYLWHYPIFVFNSYFRDYYNLEIYNYLPPLFINCVLIFMSFLIGYLSWRYIENYFRYKYNNTKILLISMFIFSFAVILSGVNEILYEKTNSKYADYVNIIEPRKTKDKFENACLLMEDTLSINLDNCVNIKESSRKNVLFIGDSLAHNLHNGFNSYKNDISTSLISATGCPPNLMNQNNNITISEKCLSMNLAIEKAITNNKFDYIFVVANYINFLEGNIFFTNNPNSLNDLKEQVINFSTIKESEVVIIGQFPSWKRNLPSVLAGKIYTGRELKNLDSKNLDKQTLIIEKDIKNWANKEKIKYISLLDILCFEDSCTQIIKIDGINYSTSFDSIHLTKEVAVYISKIIESDLFD